MVFAISQPNLLYFSMIVTTDSTNCSPVERWVALKRAFGFQKQTGIGLFGLGGFLGLLGQQHGLDVGQHAALSDGHSAHEFVQLLSRCAPPAAGDGG